MSTKVSGGGVPGAGYEVADTTSYGGSVITETVDNNKDGVVDSVGVYTDTGDGFAFYGGGSVGSNEEAVSFLRQLGLNDVVQAQGLDYPPEIRSKLGSFSSALGDFSSTNIQNTQQQWAEFLTDLKTGGIPMDVNSLVQYVLRDAYMENTKDLQFYAQKVRFFNKLKDSMRKELTEARKMYSAMQTGEAQAENFANVPVGNDIKKTGASNTIEVGNYLITFNNREIIIKSKDGQTSIVINGDPHMSVNGQAWSEGTDGKLVHFFGDSNLMLPGGICIKMDVEQVGGAYYLKGADVFCGSDKVSCDLTGNPPVAQGPVPNPGGYTPSGPTFLFSDEDGTANDNVFYDKDSDGKADGLAASNWTSKNTMAGANYNGGMGDSDDVWKAYTDKQASATAAAQEHVSYNYYEKDFSMAMNPETGLPYPGSKSNRPIKTVEDAKGYVDALESNLQSVGDDAQLANVDLQNMLQKQQQTLQMLSNISKMLHDTAMSVIRKVGG